MFLLYNFACGRKQAFEIEVKIFRKDIFWVLKNFQNFQQHQHVKKNSALENEALEGIIHLFHRLGGEVVSTGEILFALMNATAIDQTHFAAFPHVMLKAEREGQMGVHPLFRRWTYVGMGGTHPPWYFESCKCRKFDWKSGPPVPPPQGNGWGPLPTLSGYCSALMMPEKTFFWEIGTWISSYFPSNLGISICRASAATFAQTNHHQSNRYGTPSFFAPFLHWKKKQPQKKCSYCASGVYPVTGEVCDTPWESSSWHKKCQRNHLCWAKWFGYENTVHFNNLSQFFPTKENIALQRGKYAKKSKDWKWPKFFIVQKRQISRF